MRCRNCGDNKAEPPIFCDLGMQPRSNDYLTWEQLDEPEMRYPLKPWWCKTCGLIQLPAFEAPESHFNERYPFFSGASEPWVEHCKDFAEEWSRKLDHGAFVVEAASNDGTLLKEFQAYQYGVLGIEPAQAQAKAANDAGICTAESFLSESVGADCARIYGGADLVIANNVLAHVPDLDDFIKGLHNILKPDGTLVVEVPDAQNIIDGNQFDTIYHEHYNYFTRETLTDVLERRGFFVRSIEDIPTHGGSLRVTAQYVTPRWLSRARLYHYEFYNKPVEGKIQFLKNLMKARDLGMQVVGYGAPAKANTLLNFAGVDRSLMDYIVDSTPAKQGMWTPGSHIPIYDPAAIWGSQPELIIILAWNWEESIRAKLADLRWKPRIITPMEEW